ncbi:MAG TPA: dihydrodipicolinate synthase family protein [Candidatus Limnocylindrales bacterium]
MRLRGTWYIVPTPFDADGELDLPSLGRLVEAAIAWGVDGLTVMGVMAEPGALTPDERNTCLRAIFDAAAGRLPIAVGCSGAALAATLELVGQARGLGACAAMVAAPPLLRNVDQLPAYMKGAAAGGLPLIIQDEPNATGVLLPVSILLAASVASGSSTMKIEDPPTPPKIARLLAADSRLDLFGGLGGVSALGELRRGACGTMTGFAYPEILRGIRERLDAGDSRRAALLFDRYLPLIQFEAQQVVGLAIRKEVLRRRGVFSTHRTRGLAPGLDATTVEELDDLFDRLGITPAAGPFTPA